MTALQTIGLRKVNAGRLACCLMISAASVLCLKLCPDAAARNTAGAPLTESVSSGPVEITMSADPPIIRLDRDVFLTVRTRAPHDIEVRLPPLADRLTGFDLLGSFDRDPLFEGDHKIRERLFRLAPTLSSVYRIGPMAVIVTDTAVDPPEETWFATPPIVFETAAMFINGHDTSMRDIIGPVSVFPGIRTVGAWALYALLAASLAAGIWMLARKIRKAVRLRRMSPRDRALHELSELIAKDLVARNRIKDFYVELTMIVRRYIERAHKIRAPEQTTEEFLDNAILCPHFNKDVVQKLKDFLESADLVKFAAFRPDPEAIESALFTARDYITTDEAAAVKE